LVASDVADDDLSRSTKAAERRLRVLQVITHLDLGGAESIAISLVEELHDRHEASVFAVMGLGDGPVAQSMAARLDATGTIRYDGTALPFKRGGLLQAGIRLAKLIQATRPDIVHLHTELPEACWAVASRMSSQVRKTPVLRTIHNARLWPEWRAIGHWVERRLGDRHAVAVSNDALDGLMELRASAGLSPTPASGAQVIPNGVRPAPGSQRARSMNAPCRVLFAGRLERQKGADLLPEIWAATRSRTASPAELTIMGTGALKSEIKAALQDDPSVHMVPPAPGLTGVLNNFDVLLMPSRFEGLGLVAVEAVMAYLPVIGFKAPGLREVFPETYPGLVSLEDVPAIARLLAGVIDAPGSLLDATTQQSIADRFGLDRMAIGYAALYAALTVPIAVNGGTGAA
jgi:glycosyltransferase involved in cell wall biosynthesis